MALSFSGTSDFYLTGASSSPVSAVPLTFAIWVNPGADVNATAMAIGGSGAGTEAIALRHNVTARTGAMRFESTVGGTDQALTTGAMTTGSWFHLAGTGNADPSRTAFLDGVAGTPNTAVNAPVNLDQIGVGSIADNAPASVEWNGDLYAEAIWNVELAAHEIAALAAGVSPLRVRRASLAFFTVLDTLVLTDIVGGLTFNSTGGGPATGVAQDPPNFMRGALRGRGRRTSRS